MSANKKDEVKTQSPKGFTRDLMMQGNVLSNGGIFHFMIGSVCFIVWSCAPPQSSPPNKIQEARMKLIEFQQRQKHVTLTGLAHKPMTIAYTDIGKGEPILLLHGIPTWSFLYHDVIDQLAEHYRVIAPDFIGHGSSDKRDIFDRSLVAQRDMIVRLLDHLELRRVSVIGHDTGGGVALMMAIENQERVNKLVLSNIVAYDSWPIDDMLMVGHPKWKEKSNQEIKNFLVEGFDEGLSRKERLTEEFVEGIVAPYITDEGKVSLIRNASGINTSHATMLVERHRTIQAKTKLIWGVDDPWQPITDGRRLAKEIPDAELVEVENASHWIPQDAPQECVTEVLNFI